MEMEISDLPDYVSKSDMYMAFLTGVDIKFEDLPPINEYSSRTDMYLYFMCQEKLNGSSGTFPGKIDMTATTTAPQGWLICDGSAVSRETYANLYTAIGVTYGNGDGTTTFNLPDLRGRTPIGAGQLSYKFNFPTASVDITNNQINITGCKTQLYVGMPITITTTGTIIGGVTTGTTYYIAAGTNASNIKLATTTQNALTGTVVDITNVGTGTHTLNIVGTNRTIGQIGGEETHLQTVSELAPHNHARNTWTRVNGYANGSAWSALEDGVSASHWTQSTGGGNAMNNMQPFLALNYIIKY
jgi:microcystin-dependent protein